MVRDHRMGPAASFEDWSRTCRAQLMLAARRWKHHSAAVAVDRYPVIYRNRDGARSVGFR
jgi:hypothetical protein